VLQNWMILETANRAAVAGEQCADQKLLVRIDAEFAVAVAVAVVVVVVVEAAVVVGVGAVSSVSSYVIRKLDGNR
jgi:hypothetical protein